ncbi:MAG: hypothetical protein ACKV1O_28935 [Saprospiraceae bacterium]
MKYKNISTIWLIGITFLMIGCVRDTKDTSDASGKATEEIPTFQPDTIRAVADEHYNLAFQEINQMLEGRIPMNYKRAVFLEEWAYSGGVMDYEKFNNQIVKIANDLRSFIKEKGVGQYKTSGNFAIFEFFTKPHKMNNFQPYTYDFNDFYGKNNYKSVFVSKLLETHKGQCRSMPMLYKILAEEIGAESYLALGPNHMYIKHLDEQGKWVNIELTNSNFSSDSWMISTMDISAESIRKGVYMKELSMKESIAFCLIELAFAHQHKFGYSEFGLICSDISLKYYPNCMPALMHKANTLRHFGLEYLKKNGRKETPFLVENHKKFKTVEAQIEALGFREMSPEKYEAWVNSMQTEQQKRVSQNK